MKPRVKGRSAAVAADPQVVAYETVYGCVHRADTINLKFRRPSRF